MKTIVIIGFALAASACASNAIDLSPAFGKATAENNAAQIVDPSPAAGAPEGDGAAADVAAARYKTDTVKQPESGKLKPGGSTSQ